MRSKASFETFAVRAAGPAIRQLPVPREYMSLCRTRAGCHWIRFHMTTHANWAQSRSDPIPQHKLARGGANIAAPYFRNRMSAACKHSSQLSGKILPNGVLQRQLREEARAAAWDTNAKPKLCMITAMRQVGTAHQPKEARCCSEVPHFLEHSYMFGASVSKLMRHT